MDILGDFTELTKRLNQAEVEYAICGGLALAVHGFVRATKDIDVVIKDSDLIRAFEIAKAMGYDVEGLPLDFDEGAFQLRRLSKIDQEEGSLITIDFILVTEALSNVWKDRELVDWGSGAAWVVSKRGLIEMKQRAGRDQDLVDIRRLEDLLDE